MTRRPPRSTLDRSSAASDVYKRQLPALEKQVTETAAALMPAKQAMEAAAVQLSILHISEPTRPY